jgi:putative ABC transport system permease protein
MTELSGLDVVWAVILLAACLGLLALQRIALEGSLLLSYGRAILQLIVLAYAIAIGISVNSPLGTIGLLLGLGTIQTVLMANRMKMGQQAGKGDRGLWLLCGGALAIGVGLPLAYSILVILRPTSWFMPQAWLPLGSLALASSATVGASAGEQLLRSIQQQATTIETRLSLGASPSQAIAAERRSALRSALLPLVNSTAIAGLAGLSGFMAGLVFAGRDPLEAVIYELLLLLVILGGALGTAVIVTIGLERRCFNRSGQLTGMG